MLDLLNRYYPVTGKVALLFVGVLFVNLIMVHMAYEHIQMFSVWSGIFSGFMFGRWAERMMIKEYIVDSAGSVEDVRNGMKV